ncbi:MAG: glycosyltransferase family 2 protein [Sphaerochaetaceae bacterium]
MEPLIIINYVIGLLFFIFYFYQFVFIPIPWLLKKRKKSRPADMHNHYAVLICARNEENVIGSLIRSLKTQTYDTSKLDIFVLADNCSDNTATEAWQEGAKVYERFDQVHIGKGYALDFLLKKIRTNYREGFDGYFVFDADNVLKEDYIDQMNRVFSMGNDIVTSYRNSKNYGSNWISAGYGLWFLRESRYLNHARYLLGSSCAVSGTGFMFSRAVADEIGGWPFHMLTEDIEFTINQITNGKKIAYCADAQLFDEQPVTFQQSWRQRLRWSRGYLQVFRGYWRKLIHGSIHGCFSCFDISMTIMPAFILSDISLVCSVLLCILVKTSKATPMIALKSIGLLAGSMYLTLFILGAITTATEWKNIRTTTIKKILYSFTFPLFMFTYIPISFTALFVNPGWKPIRHSVNITPQRNPKLKKEQESSENVEARII